MMERIPYALDIVTILLLGNLFWMWRCCRKATLAYRKATVAYAGVRDLYKWAKKITEHVKHLGTCTGCAGSDPTWPPQDPGNFPADFE